eukprot:5475705-Amphidinium_carterae.1
MPAPSMVESEEEESKWDWWPTLASSGVQVTVPQARKTGLLLAMRVQKYLDRRRMAKSPRTLPGDGHLAPLYWVKDPVTGM